MGKYVNYEIKAFMIFSNSGGDLLLLKNDHADSIIFGYVNPAGGHLEIGETIYDLVQREAEEEMGIKNLENIELKGMINVKGFKESQILMLVVSAVVPDSENPISKGEGTPIWVKPSELKDHKILEDVERIIELVQKTPEGKIFHAVSEFENKRLVSFEAITN